MLVGVAGVARQEAHALITNPPEQRAPMAGMPAERGLSFETLTLLTSDGLHLATWYIASRNGAAVIAVHGYKADRSAMLAQAALLARHGYGVILSDLRAHGQSEGTTITFGKTEVRDLEADYQYLLTRPEVDRNRIGLLGNSMGGGVALLYAAQNKNIKAVAADSAFASLQDALGTGVQQIAHLPPFPFAPLIGYFAQQEIGSEGGQASAIGHIGEISPRAVLILQGGSDQLVPPDNGQRLYAAASQPKELWFEPALGHVEFIKRLPDEYERRVIGFFDTFLPPIAG